MTKKLLPIDKWARPGKPMKQVKGLVIHWFAKSGATANGVREYFKDVPRYASYHYAIDDTTTLLMIPENEVAYHSGAEKYCKGIRKKIGWHPNRYLLGIGMGHPDNTGEFSKDATARLIERALDICMRYDLDPMKQLYRHYDITGKLCPKFWVDNPEEWEDFKEKIKAGLRFAK